MTVKEYLRQIQTLHVKIQHRRQQAAELRQKAMSLGSPDFSSDRVQTSTDGSAIERQVAAYLDMERRAEQMAVRMEKIRDRIISEIHQLDDPNYIELLYWKYVRLKKYTEIAQETNRNADYLRHMIRKAERAFDDKYNISTKKHKRM